MKICTGCKEEKQFIEYFKCSRRKDGYHSRCKLCYKPYSSKYYKTNSELVKQRSRAGHEALRKWLWERKDLPCADCKNSFHPVCMQFDHLPDFEKVKEVSNCRSKRTLEIEVEKCEIVCANCHALRTWQRRQ